MIRRLRHLLYCLEEEKEIGGGGEETGGGGEAVNQLIYQ